MTWCEVRRPGITGRFGNNVQAPKIGDIAGSAARSVLESFSTVFGTFRTGVDNRRERVQKQHLSGIREIARNTAETAKAFAGIGFF